jgi:hypothetical protein
MVNGEWWMVNGGWWVVIEFGNINFDSKVGRTFKMISSNLESMIDWLISEIQQYNQFLV